MTDQELPVTRLAGADIEPLLERPTAEGVIARPVATHRPVANGSQRVPTTGSVSEIVSRHRG